MNVLVTGATSGIGKAIAMRLAAQGMGVGVLSRSQGRADAVIRELPGNNHIAINGDIADATEAATWVKTCIEQWGALYGLVNCAGVTQSSLLLRTQPKDIAAVMATNVTGPLLLTKAAAREMAKKRSGCIVNVGSVVGTYGNAGQSVYSASKAAIKGMTVSLAKELGPLGIRVNAIEPGFIDTPMTADLSDEARREIIERTPLKRFGTPEDVAGVAEFLFSPAAHFITGAFIPVSGGYTV